MTDDRHRTRLDTGLHDFAVLRHIAFNVRQKEGSKRPLTGKFKRAA